eukprot:TRINITY_DN11440_c0_g1_i1.p1 TRINITY_DN11440_c0_g1~~TRINITY_DN11440_c0_g1_i1.p1  ORF type:complete len:374 (+),score=53.59 TRINITY_DN11440_c0_g1_i1:182-1303(+)
MFRRFWIGSKLSTQLLCFLIVLLVMYVLFRATSEEPTRLKIGTYNIWNFMFHWTVRKRGLSEVIRRESPDIIGLQEVRESAKLGNQLNQLQSILFEYKYSVYHVATPGDETNEGLGILSKFPIIEESYVNFSIVASPDTNTRIGMRALIDVHGKPMNFYVTHLSYDRQTQCRNMNEFAAFIEATRKDHPSIVVADFNTYPDYEWPTQLLLGIDSDECKINRHFKQERAIFRDVWSSLRKGDPGLTFSLMPWPGLQSRPDRILVQEETCLREMEVDVLNNGVEYGRKYYLDVMLDRAFEEYHIDNTHALLLACGFAFSLLLLRISRKLILLLLFGWSYFGYRFFMPLTNYMLEEFFPSDHQTVMATFDISSCRT